MAIEPAIGSDLTAGVALEDGRLAAPGIAPGLGPYRLAWRRLRRNRVALAFGGLFIVIVAMECSPFFDELFVRVTRNGPVKYRR